METSSFKNLSKSQEMFRIRTKDLEIQIFIKNLNQIEMPKVDSTNPESQTSSLLIDNR